MKHEISYSEARRGLKGYFDQVCSEHAPLRVVRRNAENIIILSEDDYRSLEETAYLSQSPKNLKRILESLNRKEGKAFNEVRADLGI
jgi:antitoxin YefM